ncbi:MAG: cytochrome P450 [Solirubrobacterales bacterium]|nr:cytochrome P450 [Solirubrobacterales bacterium]
MAPPGPRTPAIVNAVRYARDPLGFHPRAHRRHGDVFRLSFPDFRDVVYVADPDLVRELFTGDPAQLHAGEANATILEPAVGPSSVLVLDDDRHLRARKLLLPPFHGRSLEAHRATIHEAAAGDLERWPVGRPFAVHPHMQAITLEVILRAVFGVRDAGRLAHAREVVAEFAEASSALMLPSVLRRDLGRWSPWRRFLRSRDALDALVREELALRRAEDDGEDRDDVLALLLRARDEDGRPMDDAALRDELVTVVGAGHETTATALTWAVERLVRHPEALARLRASLEAGETAYLDAVIKETLRVRPVIADVARRLTAPLEIGGHRLPAGTIVLAAITAVHAREDLYPDPGAFRPERFLAGDAPGTYGWIPFGGGIRRCLGAAFAQEELRIVLREVVLRADLRAGDPADERARMRNVTLAPARGGRVVLERPVRPAPAPSPALAAT